MFCVVWFVDLPHMVSCHTYINWIRNYISFKLTLNETAWENTHWFVAHCQLNTYHVSLNCKKPIFLKTKKKIYLFLWCYDFMFLWHFFKFFFFFLQLVFWSFIIIDIIYTNGLKNNCWLFVCCSQQYCFIREIFVGTEKHLAVTYNFVKNEKFCEKPYISENKEKNISLSLILRFFVLCN